jgi:hypothetical protein
MKGTSLFSEKTAAYLKQLGVFPINASTLAHGQIILIRHPFEIRQQESTVQTLKRLEEDIAVLNNMNSNASTDALKEKSCNPWEIPLGNIKSRPTQDEDRYGKSHSRP